MDESPFSLAKKTVQSFDSVDGIDSLLIPRMKTRNVTAATPAQTLPSKPTSALTEAPASVVAEKTPNFFLQMDVTGFRVEDLHVDVDAGKRLLCLSGMGPRMFKRAIPLPPSVQTIGDMACLEASIVVLDTDKSGGRHYLLVQSNPARMNDSLNEDVDDYKNHSSLSSSSLGKVAPTNTRSGDSKPSVVSSTAGRRSIKIRDETRPPLQVMAPHSVAGLCA